MRPLETKTQRSLRRHLIGIGATTLFITGGVAAVGAGTELSGAVVAMGTLVVQSNVKKVQHPTGGIVGELLVEEGARVAAGDLLLRLDATVVQANLDMITKSLWELEARRARLEAERDGAATVDFPAELLTAAAGNPEIDRIVSGERKLFGLRREALQGQRDELRSRIGQLNHEIVGLQEGSAAKDLEIQLVKRELAGVRELWDKNLIQITRLTAMEREAARLKGERGQLIASVAQANGKIAETELQILDLDQTRRSEVAKKLSDIRAKASELRERRITALDQVQRIDVRAPQAGFVHELAVLTKGGVIGPGEAIMLIVPQADKLVAEARVSPQDIDQVQAGQDASLRFPSFNQRTTPELSGHVVRVSPDISEDKRTGGSYYLVRISLEPEEVKRLSGPLVPGMPVDTFIKTSDRTLFSYLFKPLQDQAARAFREK